MVRRKFETPTRIIHKRPEPPLKRLTEDLTGSTCRRAIKRIIDSTKKNN